MPINPEAPKYPEVDTSLLQNPAGEVEFGAPFPGFDTVLIPNDQAQPELDIALLPGVPGQRGPTGPTGATGPTGPTGPAYTAQNLPPFVSYVHNQVAALTEWQITHNLNFYPNVTIVDSSGTIIEAEITYTNPTALALNFSAPLSGKAYLS
jgi:hypothetical protein